MPDADDRIAALEKHAHDLDAKLGELFTLMEMTIKAAGIDIYSRSEMRRRLTLIPGGRT